MHWQNLVLAPGVFFETGRRTARIAGCKTQVEFLHPRSPLAYRVPTSFFVINSLR